MGNTQDSPDVPDVPDAPDVMDVDSVVRFFCQSLIFARRFLTFEQVAPSPVVEPVVSPEAAVTVPDDVRPCH